ncbi:MAG: alpha/beta hydrolase [Pseudodonghicola sp.]|nr:alpha/beta hydrolase [Pseudodonghicola sp.]
MGSLVNEFENPRDSLDRDYNARASVAPEVFDAEMRNYRSRSDAARSYMTHPDVIYDALSGETLDIYGTSADLRPVFVFIHGGYWRALSKHDSAFMAPMLSEHGIATAVLDYTLAPAATLEEIIRQVRAAIAFLAKSGAQYGIDPDRIFVGGSSAGGHLTGAVISGGWHDDFDVAPNVVKGALPISGLFHLAPLTNSFVQEWMALDLSRIGPLSPCECLPSAGCPIIVAYAEGEASGFKRQSKEYFRLWLNAGFEAELIEVPSRNHFDLPLDLGTEDTTLSKALLALVNGVSSDP